MLKAAGRVGVILVLGLVLLEAVLQLASFAVWWTAPQTGARDVPEGDRVILCVGDSYTYGIGSTDPERTYPRQLEKLIRESAGAHWSVVAGARPGRDSREVLEKLPGQLRTFHPVVTYVLVGLNDRWSRPEQFDPNVSKPVDEYADERFRWEWRTRRLLALAFARKEDEESVVKRQQGDEPSAPQAPATLQTPAPDGAAAPPMPASGPRYGGQEDVAAAWAAIDGGDLATAEKLFREQIDKTHDRAPYSRMGLSHVHMQKGERQAALDQVAWLRARLAEAAYEDVAAALVAALSAMGDGEGCRREAKAWLERFPENPTLWEHLGWQTFLQGDPETGAAALEKAIALAPANLVNWRSWLYRNHARATFEIDPRASLTSTMKSYLLDGNETLLRDQLIGREKVYTNTLLEQVLQDLALPDATRQSIRHHFADTFGWESLSRLEQVYEAHLRGIVERIRAAGSEPILLSYPMPLDLVMRVAPRVAKDTGAGWLDLTRDFDEAQERVRWEDLFVADGHCNDAGYGLMARVVAADVLRRIDRR